ncbi:MAG: TetR/AcrR family transcriptional regulator [Actinomycetota bacterium]
MGLREEKKQEQRRGILETAVALFRDQGFDATRIRDVTERLRISEGTFFNHFPTKQSVLEAAAQELLARITALLHHDAEDDDRPAAERLEEIGAAFAGAFAGDRDFAALLARHTQFFLGRWSEAQWQARAYEPLTILLEDGQHRGELRADVPAGQLAELYVGMHLVTISNWLAGSPAGGALDERLRRAWAIFRDGSVLEPLPSAPPPIGPSATAVAGRTDRHGPGPGPGPDATLDDGLTHQTRAALPSSVGLDPSGRSSGRGHGSRANLGGRSTPAAVLRRKTAM